MPLRPLVCLALSSLLLGTGCSAFSRKNDRPKESSAIAADVEETFRRRWVEKRSGELAAQGLDATAALTRAGQEFHDKYGFPARK